MMRTTKKRTTVFAAIFMMLAVVIVAPQISAQNSTPEASPVAADPALAVGEEIVASVCLSCHQPGGVGIEGIYPALAGSAFVTLEDPTIVISTVLNGRGGMPRFAGNYTDEEIASILTYIRTSWGNNASPVTPEQVAEVRAATSVVP